ncbi:MAG: glycosyltransferase family 8 protein [Pseudomonadota bacterium]
MTPPRISVVFAADNILALALGVAIASVLTNRKPDTSLDIHVLSCGISTSNRQKIASQFEAGDADALHWHEITGADMKLLQDLFTASNRPYPPAAYARLLAGKLLHGVDRAIYLDTDVIVATDLTPLWETPFDGATLLAIRDLPDSNDHVPRLKALLSPEDVERFGLDQEAHYFQSGVLVFDLDAFRRSGFDELIDCLRRYPDLTFPDNDALNIVFRQRTKLVDPRWNQMASVFWYGSAAESPYDAQLFEELVHRPYIIHYSGRPKPWEDGCSHPLSGKWDEAFEVSAWRDWRPTRMSMVSDRLQRARRKITKKLRRLLP